jgi:hypothetical protein
MVVVGADDFQGWSFGPFGPLGEANDPIIRLPPYKLEERWPKLKVRVLDHEGNGLGGAWVTASNLFEPEPGDTYRIGGSTQQAQVTGPTGETVFFGSTVGTFSVVARAAGYAATIKQGIPVDSSGNATCVLQLVRGSSIKGELDAPASIRKGIPLSLLRLDGSTGGPGAEGLTATGAEGRYTVTNLSPETEYGVFVPMALATTAGVTHTVRVRTGRDGSVTEAPRLRVERTYSVSGRVVADSGVVIPRGGYFLLSRKVEGGVGGRAFEDKKMVRPDSLGFFTVSGVPKQRVEFQLSFGEAEAAPGAVSPLKRDERNLLVLDVNRDVRNLTIRLVPSPVRPPEDDAE